MYSPSRVLAVVVYLAAILVSPSGITADTLKIASTPAGATVEVDGVVVGKTPYHVKYPGGYFHGTKTIYGSLLQHPMRARISLKGYLTKDILLTDGPMERVNTNGKVRQQFFLFKSDHFDFSLEKTDETLTGTPETSGAVAGRAGARHELTVEEIVRRASPAVVLLRG